MLIGDLRADNDDDRGHHWHLHSHSDTVTLVQWDADDSVNVYESDSDIFIDNWNHLTQSRILLKERIRNIYQKLSLKATLNVKTPNQINNATM